MQIKLDIVVYAGNMKCFEWELAKDVISYIIMSITGIAVTAKWFLLCKSSFSYDIRKKIYVRKHSLQK